MKSLHLKLLLMDTRLTDNTCQWNFFQEPIESSQKLPWQGFQKNPQKIRREKRRGKREVKTEGERGKSKALHENLPGGTLNVEVIGMLVGNFFGKP